jgi:hypothetical protein
MFNPFRSDRPQAARVFWGVVYVTLLFVFFGLGYDFGGGWRGPALCFFGAADCSTAAATWTLCIISGGTIVTGVSLYLIEVQPLGATLLCPGDHGSEPGDKRPRVIDAFVVRDLRRSSVSKKPIERIIPAVTYARQEAQSPRGYVSYRVDIENLGRSPFVDLEVEVRFSRRFRDGVVPVSVRIAIGALPSGALAHLVVHVDEVIVPTKVNLSGVAWDVGQRFTIQNRHAMRRSVA